MVIPLPAGRDVLAALTALAIAAPALGAQQFFGEDTDGTESTQSNLVASINAENMFLAQLSGVGTESFEGEALGSTAPLNLTFPGAGTATLNGDGCVAAITYSPCSGIAEGDDNSTAGGTNGFGRYPITGDKYWEADAGAFAVNFSNPVAAFGFYGIDIGDFDGSLTLSFLNGADLVAAVAVPHEVGDDAGGNAFFFGFIDKLNPFDRVEFEMDVGSGDIFAFDDMTIGSAQQVVPEPMTVLLLATGLIGLGLFGLRRRGEGSETA